MRHPPMEIYVRENTEPLFSGPDRKYVKRVRSLEVKTTLGEKLAILGAKCFQPDPYLGASFRSDPCDYLSLPDYLYRALIDRYGCEHFAENGAFTELNSILCKFFLGWLGFYCCVGVYRNINWGIVTAERLAMMLELWALWPQRPCEFVQPPPCPLVCHTSLKPDLYGEWIRITCSAIAGEEGLDSDEEYGEEKEQGNDDSDEEYIPDEDDCVDDEFVFDDDSSHDSCDEDMFPEKEERRRIRDQNDKRAGFYKVVMDHCTQSETEELTLEECQRIDKEVAPGHGDIAKILGSHPTKTGSKAFDERYPIPTDPEDCLDPYELLPFLCNGLESLYGARSIKMPVPDLQAMCLLTKAASAVLYQLYNNDGANKEAEEQDQKQSAESLSPSETTATKLGVRSAPSPSNDEQESQHSNKKHKSIQTDEASSVTPGSAITGDSRDPTMTRDQFQFVTLEYIRIDSESEEHHMTQLVKYTESTPTMGEMIQKAYRKDNAKDSVHSGVFSGISEERLTRIGKGECDMTFELPVLGKLVRSDIGEVTVSEVMSAIGDNAPRPLPIKISFAEPKKMAERTRDIIDLF